jgi:signal transduction histidine kinase
MTHSQAEEPTDGASFGENPATQTGGIQHYFRTHLHRYELTPLRVTILYLLFGLGALYVSDVLLGRYVSEPLLGRLQALKGFVEVLLTAGLIFILTAGSRASLKYQTDQLQRQQQELRVLHRVIRHNLRNELNAIDGYAELVQERTDDEKRQEWCRRIKISASDLLQYTQQANRIRKISDGSNGQPETIDLSETIPQLIEKNGDVEAGEVTVDLPRRAPVEANHMLDIAINELLTNAIKHNDSSDPEVSVTVDPDSGGLAMTQIIIEDNGPGLPTNTRDVIEQVTEDPLLHMDGMGLWMVHWIVIESNGVMDINTDGTGTRVTLTIPSAMEISTGTLSLALG